MNIKRHILELICSTKYDTKPLVQETPKTKRLDSGASDTRRPAKKQRRESSTSNSNRVGSISPALNHSTPLRKSGSTLLNRPANIARPVSIFYFIIPRLAYTKVYFFKEVFSYDIV